MAAPVDDAHAPLLMTVDGRRAIEDELQDLHALRERHGGLTPAPADPRLAVQGRIARLEHALERAVVSFPDPDGPLLVAVGTVVDVADGARIRRLALQPASTVARVAGDVHRLDVDAPLGRALLWRTRGEALYVPAVGRPPRRLLVLRVTGLGAGGLRRSRGAAVAAWCRRRWVRRPRPRAG